MEEKRNYERGKGQIDLNWTENLFILRILGERERSRGAENRERWLDRG